MAAFGLFAPLAASESINVSEILKAAQTPNEGLKFILAAFCAQPLAPSPLSYSELNAISSTS